MLLKMSGKENRNCHLKFIFSRTKMRASALGGVRWSKDSFRKTVPCFDSAAKVLKSS